MIEALIKMMSSVALITVFMYGAKLFCNQRIEKVYGLTEKGLMESKNYGFTILRVGILIGIAVAMLGTINGSVLIQAGNGVLALVFIYIAIVWSDRALFPNIDDRKEIIVNGNLSMGIVLSSFIIATGIISYSSFMGTGPWWTSILFFVIGQIVLVAMSRVYEMMHPELLENIADGKVGSGLLLGGMFIAFAFILNGALAGNFVSIEADLIAIGISLLIGVVTMVVFVNGVVDKLFVSHIKLSEMLETDNIPAIAIITIVKILIALVIGYVVI
jgi:uncharacterized membrane protein YjfL (UPF0719 family)